MAKGWEGKRQGSQGGGRGGRGGSRGGGVSSAHTGGGGGKRLHTGRAPVALNVAKSQYGNGGSGTGSSWKGNNSGGGKWKKTLTRAQLRAQRQVDDEFANSYGYRMFREGPARIGWLLNMLPVTLEDPSGGEVSAVELFFLKQDGSTFRSIVVHEPYFYVFVPERFSKDAKGMLERRFETEINRVVVRNRVDLDMDNHLSGLKRTCLQLCFRNVNDLMKVRREILPIVNKNKAKAASIEAYGDANDDVTDKLIDIREYDVPYYVRVSIDLGINVGCWFEVSPLTAIDLDNAAAAERGDPNSMTQAQALNNETNATKLRQQHETITALGGVRVTKQDMVVKAEPRVLAFDIECCKQPLKFPDAAHDQVFMISYMLDGVGYLIINREVVSEDIEDFEYNPRPEFPGPFSIFNEKDERATIDRFFTHVREVRPSIFVTYNGDYFDWPYVRDRALVYGMDMAREIGVVGNEAGEFTGRCAVHMDCLYWVKRDSYLPAGSRGLKAVTKAKLGYDPVEVDPEDMVRYAREKPHHMASYSVSDAVATFYLYDKYINLFVFSLCTIIPLTADDVLRKGSGTLCEMLLMVEAFEKNIICPNKQQDAEEKFYEGHLLESETYVGGHVECLESGVFRDDIPCKFNVDSKAYQELIDNIDRDLSFAIEVESGVARRHVTNYDEVRGTIVEQLELLRDTPVREEVPTIYHLDVAAMYPNIILTNRLQPCAIVDETTCAGCDFNHESNGCKRDMEWVWRGDFYPTSRPQYESIKKQIQFEVFNGVPFQSLPKSDQALKLRQRVKDYCQRAYKQKKQTLEVKRTATVCQRENPFYVDTVKAFRDRRYDYKGLTKTWAKKRRDAESSEDMVALEECSNKVLIYDSLQLAHKCILNSFYGYVMRRGARWHSMEMAGIVTNTGGDIIKQARMLVERIGRPLELDTDGIWCILPSSFPENFNFKVKKGKAINISYPCVMLNADVHATFTNHQYQNLTNPIKRKYETTSDCSIFFEVDGPYRCMVLPASQEEGKLLKKRYAVFNHDGSLAELKGFELKRRGELKIIKIFQSQVFEKFLDGASLQECYSSVAEVADHWLDVLHTRGKHLTDEEVIELISENRMMSRTLEEYGEQKSTTISAAKRLAQFLGNDMVKEKGLACKLLIAAKPAGAPTTERAIPIAIFATEPAIRDQYLRRWLKDSSMTNFDIRTIIDWDYYIDRLGKAVQKIITIPAALQKIANPVPRVKHPDWLGRLVREKHDPFKQRKLADLFGRSTACPSTAQGGLASPSSSSQAKEVGDMEDIGGAASGVGASGMKNRSIVRMSNSSRRRTTASQHSSVGGGESNGPVQLQIEDNNPNTSTVMTKSPQNKTTTPVTLEESGNFGLWIAGRKNQWRDRRRRLAGRRPLGHLEELSKALVARIDPVKNYNAYAVHGHARLELGASDVSGNALGTLNNKSNKANARMANKALASTRNGMAGYVNNAQLQILTCSHWQILEVRAEPEPGLFRAYVMVSRTEMHTVFVRVPRVIYVNKTMASRDANHNSGREDLPAEVTEQPVTKVLPHQHPVGRLSQLEMDEALFQRNPKELSDYLTHPDVLGVYESQVALESRLVANLGCVARVRPDDARDLRRERVATGTTSRSPLQSKLLERLTSTANPYLEPSVAVYRRLFLYQAGERDRQLFVLFVVNDSSDDLEKALEREEKKNEELGEAEHESDVRLVPNNATCYTWFSHASTSASAIPNLNRLWRTMLEQHGALNTETGDEQDGNSTSNNSPQVHFEQPRRLKGVGKCWEAISKQISKYSKERRGPTVVVTQVAVGKTECVRRVPALAGFPVVNMVAHEQDSSLPVLQWQRFLCERAVGRYLLHTPWWVDRVACARYAHIPIAHVGDDYTRMMADTFFHRMLDHNRMVLWSSPADKPDLGDGGAGSDVTHLDVVEEHENPRVMTPGVYRGVCVELDILHLAVCTVIEAERITEIECGEGSLFLEEIVTGGTTDQGLEGAFGGGVGGGGAGPAQGSGGECVRAFKVLKATVENWWDDVQRSGNSFADSLLMHFYRWLCSPRSQLHDPALHRFVHQLMHKVLLQLLAEMRRLGAKVIFANFQRVILHTNKHDGELAKSYVDHMIRTITSKPMFQWVTLRPRRTWEQFVFMDEANFGGVTAAPPRPPRALEDADSRTNPLQENDPVEEEDKPLHEDVSSGDEQNEGEENTDESGKRKLRVRDGKGKARTEEGELQKRARVEDQEWVNRVRTEAGDIEDDNNKEEDGNERRRAAQQQQQQEPQQSLESNWNICEYLPEPIRERFEMVVGEFVYKPLAFARRFAEENEALQAQAMAGLLEPDMVAPVSLDSEEYSTRELEFVQNLIQTKLTRKLLRMVPKIELEEHSGRDAFPVHAGSHLDMHNPAIEFVKAVCAVLELDTSVKTETSVLKRQLLRMCHVREFSKESIFVNPSLSLVLPDVICTFCNFCTDLDLCKTDGLVNPEGEDDLDGVGIRGGGPRDGGKWKCACAECGHAYDADTTEHALVKRVQQRSLAYQLQDLVCSKCRQVKVGELTEYCECAGQWVCKYDPRSMATWLAPFRNVARFHGFEWLGAVVEDLNNSVSVQ